VTGRVGKTDADRKPQGVTEYSRTEAQICAKSFDPGSDAKPERHGRLALHRFMLALWRCVVG
jgi:hypothetical protein